MKRPSAPVRVEMRDTPIWTGSTPEFDGLEGPDTEVDGGLRIPAKEPRHGPGSLYEAFPPAEAKELWDRFEFLCTPKHGSRLNMAEIEINVLIRQCLDRRIDTPGEMRTETHAWQHARETAQSRIDWQFTSDDARIS